MPQDPFEIPRFSGPRLATALFGVARPIVSRVLGLDQCGRVYREAQGLPHATFIARALAALEIEPACAPADLVHVPATGALIVAANHAHGALDGLVLASLLLRVRPDVRLLSNYLLSRIPELNDWCFFVDPFGGANAASRSRAGLRAAHLWLRRGGALVMFPAGAVAHERRSNGMAVDPPWQPSVGRLALATGAQVLPAFIAGSNSRVFYAAGRIHPRLRTVLLGRELLDKRGAAVRVAFGPSLSGADRRERSGNAVTTTHTIRERVERLADPAADVSALAPSCRLIDGDRFEVYCAAAPQIPAALREIGRLREIAFRRAGEGTGRDVDLDRFDEHYLHLFAWDRQRQQIVGAYRLGPTDRILPAHGASGLYTRTLFSFDERLLNRLTPALELGRSFVRVEYQKSHAALLLLWRGIARYVALHPQYRVLFGPVSISARYSDMSQRLLIAFLEQNHRHADLAALVGAMNRRTRSPVGVAAVPRSVEEINRAVAAVEGGMGIPVLLRQYLKLNARLLGFNVDPAFADVLDALMMVDLTTVDRTILARYFGAPEAAAFLERHAAKAA